MQGQDVQTQRFRLSDQYQQLKSSFHRHLIQQVEERNLDLDRWDSAKIDRFVTEQIRRYVVEQRLPVNQRESEVLARDARDELVGFGPIQSLVDDDSVNDIVVNGPATVFVERDGVLGLLDGDVYTSELPWTKPSPLAFVAAMEAVGASDASRCTGSASSAASSMMAWSASDSDPKSCAPIISGAGE